MERATGTLRPVCSPAALPQLFAGPGVGQESSRNIDYFLNSRLVHPHNSLRRAVRGVMFQAHHCSVKLAA